MVARHAPDEGRAARRGWAFGSGGGVLRRAFRASALIRPSGTFSLKGEWNSYSFTAPVIDET
jgi:hypothetical protein